MVHEDKRLVKKNTRDVNMGIEEKLWLAADKLRGYVDVAEYKHIVLRLIFLKYISDVFQDHFENHNEHTSAKIIRLPEQARWSFLQERANSPEIYKLIDNALAIIEEENSSLKGALRREHTYSTRDSYYISELINLISNIGTNDAQSFPQNNLVSAYEYCLRKFADAESKRSGEFYTPRYVVKLLVEMLEPYKGRLYDPCCGTGGMFVQSGKFVQTHGGQINDLSMFGQESNFATWQLCKMNLAIQGIEADLGEYPEDTFYNDLHKGIRADFILANPPLNVTNWGNERLRQDVRWKYGVPPASNANFAWVQHFIYHLAPDGIAGFILSNGSMFSNRSGESEIRKSIVEADLVDCIVALPDKLFYATQLPICLWILTNNKANGRFRNRQGHTLFIDARKLGYLADRSHRELTDDEIFYIAQSYHTWRGEPSSGAYVNIPGFCKNVKKEEIADQGYVLVPERYVGEEEIKGDNEPFSNKLDRLTAKLEEQFTESRRLEILIKERLKRLEYGK